MGENIVTSWDPRASGGMADAQDSKSCDGNIVRVQVPPRPQIMSKNSVLVKASFVLMVLLFASTALAHKDGRADPFYGSVASTEHIKEHYKEGELKILIVPGHSKDSGGTEFAGVLERDLNVILADKLASKLGVNKNFRIFVARDLTKDYSPWLKEYMLSGRQDILLFQSQAMKAYNSLKSGLPAATGQVHHNTASSEAAFELYALNKFANDNKIDIAIHIHINDYPRAKAWEAGKHNGFTIYTPDSTFANHEASLSLAKHLRDHLAKIMPVSTLPGEDTGVTLDRELVAIGSHGSRDNASILIEYGYIYEPQFLQPDLSEFYFNYLASESAAAINKYFDKDATSTPALQHLFGKTLKRGQVKSLDVLALQIKLLGTGQYPPLGRTLRDCPVTGSFGPCTQSAVAQFQTSKGLEPVGFVGPKTREALNRN